MAHPLWISNQCCRDGRILSDYRSVRRSLLIVVDATMAPAPDRAAPMAMIDLKPAMKDSSMAWRIICFIAGFRFGGIAMAANFVD